MGHEHPDLHRRATNENWERGGEEGKKGGAEERGMRKEGRSATNPIKREALLLKKRF